LSRFTCKQPRKVKYWFLFFIYILPFTARSQYADSNYLKALYDRCLDFDENKADSIAIYADIISKEAIKLKYDRGEVLAARLKGLSKDLKGDYEEAISYYLISLAAARKLLAQNYEIAALTDLAYVYVNTKQPLKARDVYLAGVRLSEAEGDIHSIVTAYGNLGGIYNQLKQPDSALFFLNKGLLMAKPYEKLLDLSSFYNNLGNVYFEKKDNEKALYYFQKNYYRHLQDSSQTVIWYDYLNIGDVFIEQGKFDSAYWYAQQALLLAKKMESKSKEADSYALLSRLYLRKADYKSAYDFKQKWYTLDTGLVNGETNKTIADLQESFNARQREVDNKLLQSGIEKAQLRNRIITFLALAAAIIALIVAVSLVQKRRANLKLTQQNDLINRQNRKLAELNEEKNSLISIVSHDLGTPFASIKMWGQLLQADAINLNADQQKAIERINQSTAKGELLIRSILDIEKAGTNQHKILLENFDLKIFVESIVADFEPAASGKNIHLHFETPDKHVYMISDKQLVSRICENLFSNAIKYSLPGKNVWINLSGTNDAVRLRVRDEGVGIAKDELPNLFSKYSKISSKPTSGETSTGLGLSIVKRVVDELNGSVFCESEPGKGSLFTVVLKK
jgi:signal transduction histidine kinase